MGKLIKGPIEIIDSGAFGTQSVRGDDRFAGESERLFDFLELSGEPAVDNLPSPINLQGLYDQTVEQATCLADQIASEARSLAVKLEANAHAEAEKILQDARAEGQRLIQQAREAAENEANTIREAAHQSGFQKGYEEGTQAGHEEGLAAGHREGWDQGYKEGWEQGHQEFVDAINHLKQLTNQIIEQREQIVNQTEPELIGLVFDIAEKVVHHQISTDHVIYHTVKSMLEYTIGHEKVHLYINPDDIRHLEPYRNEFLAEMGQAMSLEIIEDPNIAAGGCLLKTNLGTIDAQIDTQLAKVKQALES